MRTLYRAERVITAQNSLMTAKGDMAVVIEDTQIIYVGPLEAMPNVEVDSALDFGPDSTLLPGLIDTHVHLAFDGSADPVSVIRTATTNQALTIMLKSARQLLSAGVTTARDLGAPNLLDQDVKNAIDQGLARGPRVVTANAPLTVTGGHCWFFGAECDGVDEVRRQVRLARRNGADSIKVMSTGGNMTAGSMPAEPQFTEEELIAIVAEAHRYKMKVTAHAHGTEGIRRAINAGVDSLEHFSFTQHDGSMREESEIVDMAAQAGIYVCKTFCAAWGTITKKQPHLPHDMMRSLIDRGIRIVAGTDAGIDDTPHTEYVVGLEGHAAFGMTNAEVLNSATHLAAESLGLAKDIGSLEAGKSADLLVVRGNPLEDLAHLRNVLSVVVRGVEYTPEFRAENTWNQLVDAPKYDPAAANSSAPLTALLT